MTKPNLRIKVAPEYDANRIRATLQDCEAYFEQRADAEYSTDSPFPTGNEEMRLLMDVQDALGRVK